MAAAIYKVKEQIVRLLPCKQRSVAIVDHYDVRSTQLACSQPCGMHEKQDIAVQRHKHSMAQLSVCDPLLAPLGCFSLTLSWLANPCTFEHHDDPGASCPGTPCLPPSGGCRSLTHWQWSGLASCHKPCTENPAAACTAS